MVVEAFGNFLEYDVCVGLIRGRKTVRIFM